jgi:hypothetical protein
LKKLRLVEFYELEALRAGSGGAGCYIRCL